MRRAVLPDRASIFQITFGDKIVRSRFLDNLRTERSASFYLENEIMPKYQMYFDTVRGEVRYNVDIDEEESLNMVLEEILFDLRERGDVLKGDGEPEVVWNGKSLDFAQALVHQGVRANDVLRISTLATNG